MNDTGTPDVRSGGGVADAADAKENAGMARRKMAEHKFVRMPDGAHFCIFCGTFVLDDEELEMYRDTECIRFGEHGGEC